MQANQKVTWLRALVFCVVLLVPLTATAFPESASVAEAAPASDVVDELPVGGWTLTAYLNGDWDSSNPWEWPTLFRFAVDGWAVKWHCLQSLTPVPPIGTGTGDTSCRREGNKLYCTSPGGTQNEFEFVEVIEYPPSQPKLERFEVSKQCSTPNQHSNDLDVEVRAYSDQGGSFGGAEVRINYGSDPVVGTTGGDGRFAHRILNARALTLIGTQVTVEVGDLDLQSFIIAEELFGPCTAHCHSLVAEYDPANKLIKLTGSGGPAGMGYTISDMTADPSTQLSSGTVDETEIFAAEDTTVALGWNRYQEQVGGELGPICPAEIEILYPASFEPSGSCTSPGQDSSDLKISGRMLDQHGNLYLPAVDVTFTYPDPNQPPVVVTIEGGVLGSPVFLGAKLYLGQKILISWEPSGAAELVVTSAMFDACVSPPPAPTPTATALPGFGNDPNAPPVPMAAQVMPTPYMANAMRSTADGMKFPLMALVVVLTVGMVKCLWRRI